MSRAAMPFLALALVASNTAPAAASIDPGSFLTPLGFAVRGKTVVLFEGDDWKMDTCVLASGDNAMLRTLKKAKNLPHLRDSGRAHFWLERTSARIPDPLDPREFVQFDREVTVRGQLVSALCGEGTVYWIKKVTFGHLKNEALACLPSKRPEQTSLSTA